MVELHIKIRKRIARLAYGENFVSYNEGYKIIFDFDREWDSIENKTARFIFGENYIDYPFNGNEVEIPLIKNADTLEIGVYSDNLYTTTAVKFRVLKSIKDEEKIEILVPEAYPEIEELDNEDLIRVYDKSEEKIGISPLKKLFDKMGVAIDDALAAAKASGEFDGITPTIGENGNWYLGDTDTNKPSRGEKGETGARGEKGDTGATGTDGKSAYSYAVDGGYSGTEAEFAAKLAAESIDKALYVVNATIDFDSFELSVDKTFEEIKQAYDEGKYSIVLSLMGASTAPLIGMSSEGCVFVSVTAAQHAIVSVTVDTVKITKDNVIETYSADLATTDSELPNPYPLTFTGAVNETYDGSSAKTIEIPSGGGASLGNFERIGTVSFSKEGMAAAGAGVDFEVSDVSEIVLIYKNLVNSTTSNNFVNVYLNKSSQKTELSLRPDSGKSGSPVSGWAFIKLLPGVGLTGIQSNSTFSATNYTLGNAKTPYNMIPLASDFRITEITIQNPSSQYYAVGGIVQVYVR